MYQYTTPTITLTLADVDFAEVATFRVTLENKGTELLKVIPVSDSSVDATDHTITISLTQEETASLAVGGVEVQVRVVFTDNTILATEKKRIEMRSVLDEVVV